MQRAGRHETIDRQLVQRDKVLAGRLGRIAFHGHQVADVVVHADLVQHLAFAEVPLRHLGINVQRGVGDAGLAVVLGMQGAEAQRYLGMQRILHADHRNAVGILGFELARLDRGHDLLEGIYRHVRVELAGDSEELAIGRHIDAVRRLRLGDQEQDALLDRGFHHQHVMAVDLLGLALGHQFGGPLPVDHVQVVGVLRRAAGLIRRATLLDAADITLGAERVGKRPAVGRTLAEVGQILRVGRQFERERLLGIDAAFLAIELPVGHAAAIFLVELFEREELLVFQRRGILRGLDHVLGVGTDEGAAVLRLEDRVDHDLLGLEVAQVDHRQARVGLVVDEQELAVVLAVGFGNGRMVGIAPGNVLAVDAALLQHVLRAFVEAIALPGLRREYADVLEDAHRGNRIDDHLARLTAGTEGDEFIALAGWHVSLRRRQQILLAQPARLQHVLQGVGRPGGGRQPHPGRQQQRGGLLVKLLHVCRSHFRLKLRWPSFRCIYHPIAAATSCRCDNLPHI
jgi:hypothetical protein